MNLEKIQNIDKTIITIEDLRRSLGISKKSAQVTASRYVKAKLLIRLKRELYILPQRFKSLTETEIFEIANLLQTPSYISLTTALSFYNLTTQQTPNFFQSIAIKRTKEFNVLGKEFNFTLVKKEFYFGFTKKENFFIALPDKALADAIYLTAIGKYNADFDAIDFNKFDKEKVTAIINKSNKTAKNLWQKLINNYAI
jgi:predicted transcriptional regulator of viral defense system